MRQARSRPATPTGASGPEVWVVGPKVGPKNICHDWGDSTMDLCGLTYGLIIMMAGEECQTRTTFIYESYIVDLLYDIYRMG